MQYNENATSESALVTNPNSFPTNINDEFRIKLQDLLSSMATANALTGRDS